jgi:hypothetical protein
MNLANFYLKFDALTNKPEAHPDIDVKIMTLDGEFPIGAIELQEYPKGTWTLFIQSNEPVHREPWE